MQNPSKPHIFIGSRKTLLLSIATSCQSNLMSWWYNIFHWLHIISRWFSALLCPRWPGGAAVERGVRSGHQGRSVTCHVSHSLLIRDGGTGLENWEETSDPCPCTVNQGPAFYQPILLGRAEQSQSVIPIFHWCWTFEIIFNSPSELVLKCKSKIWC